MGDREERGVARGDLTRLLRKVNEERGLDLGQYRTAYLERRIASRLRAVDITTYGRYARFLDEHPEEYPALLDALTINVTDFFRDSEVYKVFESKVIPQMLEHKTARRQRMIRAWSAGCSTGEEPYSIAMSILGVLGDKSDEYLISMLGTDIDDAALEVARRGEYSNDDLENISFAHRRRFLTEGINTFTMKPEVMQLMRFRHLNLFEDRPIHVVDVIFCRNVFIYFTREQQAKVMDRFWSALHKGGYLVLGRSEKLSPSLASRLELIDGRQRVYRKPSA